MILSFKTKINGKPTYFVEKIHSGLLQNDIVDFEGISFKDRDFDVNQFVKSEPKIHTIRKDEKDRWKTGIMIDFFINARQKDMFRFAPRIPVVSVQKIEIKHVKNNQFYRDHIGVKIDGVIMSLEQVSKLAYNDGFETVADFFQYFKEDFKGKIIHWTKLQY